MPPKTPTALVARVIAAMAYVAAAFEVALDLDDEPDDDHEVLLDQIDCAGRHLADVVWTLHPQWRDLDRRTAESHALTVFRRHRPDIDDSARGRRATVDLLQDAADQVADGVRLARKQRSEARYRDVATELDFAADHLDNAIYLLDPDSFSANIDAATPAQRVKLASRLEVIELELEENRDIVRARREGANMDR